MAFSLSSFATISCSNPGNNSCLRLNKLSSRIQRSWIRCETREVSEEETQQSPRSSKLKIGSPIIVIEAPTMIKTAASVPCLRVNSGLVKPGDVGRIMSRKPKDVWAVRLSIGTYLIDGKYFKALELDQ